MWAAQNHHPLLNVSLLHASVQPEHPRGIEQNRQELPSIDLIGHFLNARLIFDCPAQSNTLSCARVSITSNESTKTGRVQRDASCAYYTLGLS